MPSLYIVHVFDLYRMYNTVLYFSLSLCDGGIQHILQYDWLQELGGGSFLIQLAHGRQNRCIDLFFVN